MVAVLNSECVTLVSMVRRGAMVSVATTTANDSIAVLLLPSSIDGSQISRLLKLPTSLISWMSTVNSISSLPFTRFYLNKLIATWARC